MSLKVNFLSRHWIPEELKIFIPLLFLIMSSCDHDYEYENYQSKKVERNYKTQNVIIVIADGLRYSEGWGDSTHRYIPRMAYDLAKSGVINTRFYNLGDTYTLAGHTSITTGIYQTINNAGEELPDNPSFFQYWNRVYPRNKLKSWIIASKDKLAVLGDCKKPYWSAKFIPSVNTGVNGLGLHSGYREDSLTLITALNILKEDHPNLVLINFREPDYSGHSGVWESYVDGIRKTDEYIYQIWQFVQNDPNYKNTTTLFITSDHGRHLDSIADGFAGHGDGCEGCRHLWFFACGPDFKKGTQTAVSREQIDLPVTIAELMGFKMPNIQGKIMTELFGHR